MATTLDIKSMIPVNFEPKRKTRWILMIEGIDAWLVSAAARPKYTQGEVEIKYINSRRYLAGLTVFETIAVKLHDPIAPSGAQQVMEWLRLHYESVSGRAGYADFYKRDVQLKLLDPIGTLIECWDFSGCWIKDANFGDLEYGSDDIVGVELTLRFDNCVLQF